MVIKIIKNGPYCVTCDIPLDEKTITNDYGNTIYTDEKKCNVEENYMLCRCGHSCDKPFCDGTHERINFDGTETADKDPFSKCVTIYENEKLRLEDAECLCANARFCHSRMGDVWELTENNMNDQAIKMACECPAGRLVMYDKLSNTPIEVAYAPGISVLNDSYKKCIGPLFVKGGIPIKSSSGEQYQVRNRVTLCRCGKSRNKPFCDSSHLDNN